MIFNFLQIFQKTLTMPCFSFKHVCDSMCEWKYLRTSVNLRMSKCIKELVWFVMKALRLLCVPNGSWCVGSLVCSKLKRKGESHLLLHNPKSFYCITRRAQLALVSFLVLCFFLSFSTLTLTTFYLLLA